MLGHVLQFDPDSGPLGPWFNGSWQEAMFEPTTSLVGEPLLGAFFAVPILVGFYFAGDGSLAAPSVLTILLGAFMLPVFPGNLAGLAYGVAFIGTVAALAAIGRGWLIE